MKETIPKYNGPENCYNCTEIYCAADHACGSMQGDIGPCEMYVSCYPHAGAEIPEKGRLSPCPMEEDHQELVDAYNAGKASMWSPMPEKGYYSSKEYDAYFSGQYWENEFESGALDLDLQVTCTIDYSNKILNKVENTP